jgi:hypothetical protein
MPRMPCNPLYETCGVYAIICTGDGSIYIGAICIILEIVLCRAPSACCVSLSNELSVDG